MRARLLALGLSLGLLATILWTSTSGESGREPGAGTLEAGTAPQPQVGLTSTAASPTVRPTPSRPRPSPQSAAGPSEAAPALAPLSEELRDFVADLDGEYGVAVHALGDGQTVLINADRIFPIASLYKLLVMYRVYQLMDWGELSPDDYLAFEAEDLLEAEECDGVSPGDIVTLGEAMELMITSSSNPAAYLLVRYSGGWWQMDVAAAELAMESVAFDGEHYVATPADILRFFELLGTHSLVSPEASEDMIDILLRQQVNDRLPADLPPDILVAHKTGDLPGIRNDAGILFTPNGPIAIAIMSEEIDPSQAVWAQATISRMVFDRLGISP